MRRAAVCILIAAAALILYSCEEPKVEADIGSLIG